MGGQGGEWWTEVGVLWCGAGCEEGTGETGQRGKEVSPITHLFSCFPGVPVFCLLSQSSLLPLLSLPCHLLSSVSCCPCLGPTPG